MAMEVSCGQCRGRLLVETPGVIVACPHCGVHLSIPFPEREPVAPTPPATQSSSILPPSNLPPQPTPHIPEHLLGPESSRAETIVLSGSSKLVPQTDASIGSLSSIFHSLDDLSSEEPPEDSMGWHSSPNLSLKDVPASPTAQIEETVTTPPEVVTETKAPDFSWMSSGQSPKAPEVANPFSFGDNLSESTPQAKPPEAEEIPAPGAFNFSSAEAQATSSVSPEIIHPSVSTNAGSPDFSWMGQTEPPNVVEPATPFSFGEAPANIEAVAESALTSVVSDTATQASETSPASPEVAPEVPAVADTNMLDLFKPSTAADVTIEHPSPNLSINIEKAELPWVIPIHAPQPSSPSEPGSVSGGGLPSFDISLANGLASFAAPQINEQPPQKLAAAPMESHAAVGASDSDDSRSAFLMTLLIVVGSYASLTTIYLIYSFLFGRTHQLESLPDLKTVQQQGGRAAVPRPENNLPPGHDLRFGQTQQFGNIRVTPLRVTRGPIEFKHETGDRTVERSASDPVLKLWLKFENVSANQTITPLDTTLMFFRRILDDRVASYNAIFKNDDRNKKNVEFNIPFRRMEPDSPWLIVGQHTNEAIAPHETLETFIPSEENLEGLDGDLVWRVHFRKGHGPKTGNGVTTLIDVHFNTKDIKPEAT